MKENACFDTLVERLIGCDPVEAIGLGGSRATGKADIHSDYDLYVYVTEEMPLEIRKQLFDGLFRIMEYDNMFWEREDDGIFKDGIPIDILYRRIGDFDRTLEPVVTGHQPYNAYTTCMWNNLLNTKILFDRSGRLTQLKQKYDIPYPEELKKNIIKRHQALLFDGLPNYADQLRKAIGRKDLPAMNHRAAGFMETYFDLLFALNKTTHPGEKRMVQEAKKLAVVPEHFEQDLEAFFSHLYTDPQKAAADLDRIEQRMKKILNEVQIVPGLDHPEDVRALFEE
ncbi:DUF4037 domain-containing protein [uncultured Dubosiella sp.]|uniref:DUF4037 domain-containing protein n=3 Tax=uncultured Dubosiella sp. TaxID=1937011 RepID=UPI00208D5D78|nr:DUF4037 domain-containing protein [uncultured Dubosiella sp.]GJM57409.1 nucleotidyltransferase [Erysipelotrichaceae bacterium OPF54]